MTFRGPLIAPQPGAPRQQHEVTGPNLPIRSIRPFRQLDWPNPTRSYGADTGFAVNLLESTLRPIAKPFVQSDWPNQPASFRQQDTVFPNLAIRAPLAATMPFALLDWPNAQHAPQIIVDNFPNLTILLPGPTPSATGTPIFRRTRSRSRGR